MARVIGSPSMRCLLALVLALSVVGVIINLRAELNLRIHDTTKLRRIRKYEESVEGSLRATRAPHRTRKQSQ